MNVYFRHPKISNGRLKYSIQAKLFHLETGSKDGCVHVFGEMHVFPFIDYLMLFGSPSL